jgi:hypothetical protein
MYLSKETIIKAYETLNKANPDNFSTYSAIQYFVATDRFFKSKSEPCNSSNKESKQEFCRYVEDVVALDDGHYLSNFKTVYDGSKSLSSTVGSNFFNGSSVEHSNNASGKQFDYPKNAPLIYAQDGKVCKKDEYYQNIDKYLASEHQRLALAIWLLRKNAIFDQLNKEEFAQGLAEFYTDDLVGILIPNESKDWDEMKNFFSMKCSSDMAIITVPDINKTRDLPLQQIFYGAPGTGKSHRITDDDGVKKADENNLVFRTTFHPDSDYSTFVGCYKPTMDEDGGSGEEKIVYRFIPQVFTDAYIAAWRTNEDVYLIIEEINRGNCAQIFGDLFQLLDRDGEGYSKYEIKPDIDLTKYIAGCKLDISGIKNSNGNDISKKIASGEVLKLPKNLYIWATMNTSDQSLFPIDSAFKRRWDWEYIPIDYNCPESNYTIIVDDKHKYSWPKFLKNVNDLIYDTTKSEDKQMGNFFLSNVKGKEIGCDKFVSKVMFYLWNDICKDNPKAQKSIYSCKLEEPEEGKEDIREFKFSDLFPAGEERNELLIGFMTYLEIENIPDNKDKE